MIKRFSGSSPTLDRTVFVADGAAVIGNVSMGAHSSVWFNAVVRGDLAPITVGEHSNIQDNCTVHVDRDKPCVIGNYVTVGHNAVVHSANIGDRVLIGMNATVLNGAIVGEGSIIGAGALVTENTVIPPRSLAVGVPAKVIKSISDDALARIVENAEDYSREAKAYADTAPDIRG